MEMDRKVLRFYAVWDDRDSMFGEMRKFIIHVSEINYPFYYTPIARWAYYVMALSVCLCLSKDTRFHAVTQNFLQLSLILGIYSFPIGL